MQVKKSATFLLIVTVSAASLLVSGRPSWTWADYMAIHKDGMQKLEASRQMNGHYGEVDNFIVHFGFGKQPLEWQTVAFMEGRFTLTLVVPVTVDYSKRTVTQAGKARFHLWASEKVNLLPDGRPEEWYATELQREFGEAEWEKFVRSGFDLTSLGIPNAEIRPIDNFDVMVRAIRGPRLPIK